MNVNESIDPRNGLTGKYKVSNGIYHNRLIELMSCLCMYQKVTSKSATLMNVNVERLSKLTYLMGYIHSHVHIYALCYNIGTKL